MSLSLRGRVGDRERDWPLEGAVLTIGRSSRHAIHIADATVSKDHAEITARGGQRFVRDLGSRNGTRVNGRDAREATVIEAGDQLEIGHVVLRVVGDEALPRPALNERSLVGTTLRLRADGILEDRSRRGKDSAHIVRLLSEAGRLLVLPRPLQETCDELLRFVERAVPASRHVLLLAPEPGAEPVQIAARARGGRTDQPLVLSRAIMRKVLDQCASVLTRDAAADPRFSGAESIVAQSVHSAMAVPLFDDERVLGLLYADTSDLRVTFDEDQLELLTLLANMAAVKITNARLLEAEQVRQRMEQELATATRIQRGLLRESPPELPGWELDAFLESCYEVGGDLYDLHRRADGRLVLMVGDVTGKGMGAALLMSSFLASARVLYESCADPGELARRLDAMLHASTDRRLFVTGFIGCLDPASGRLEFVNAGHPPGLVRGPAGLRPLESGGPPFGVVGGFPYAVAAATLAPGEVLALVTDGIPEAQRGDELFDDRRLHEALLEAPAEAPLSELREFVVTRVDEFLGDAPRTDDLTLLLVRRSA